MILVQKIPTSTYLSPRIISPISVRQSRQHAQNAYQPMQLSQFSFSDQMRGQSPGKNMLNISTGHAAGGENSRKPSPQSQQETVESQKINQLNAQLKSVSKDMFQLIEQNRLLLSQLESWRDKFESINEERDQLIAKNNEIQGKILFYQKQLSAQQQQICQPREAQKQPLVDSSTNPAASQDTQARILQLQDELESWKLKCEELEQNHYKEISLLKTNLKNSFIAEDDEEEVENTAVGGQNADLGTQEKQNPERAQPVRQKPEHQPLSEEERKDLDRLQQEKDQLEQEVKRLSLQHQYLTLENKADQQKFIQRVLLDCENQKQQREQQMQAQIKKLKEENEKLQDIHSKLRQEVAISSQTKPVQNQAMKDLLINTIFQNEEDYVYDEDRGPELQQQKDMILESLSEKEKYILQIQYFRQKNEKLESELLEWKRQFWNLEKKYQAFDTSRNQNTGHDFEEEGDEGQKMWPDQLSGPGQLAPNPEGEQQFQPNYNPKKMGSKLADLQNQLNQFKKKKQLKSAGVNQDSSFQRSNLNKTQIVGGTVAADSRQMKLIETYITNANKMSHQNHVVSENFVGRPREQKAHLPLDQQYFTHQTPKTSGANPSTNQLKKQNQI